MSTVTPIELIKLTAEAVSSDKLSCLRLEEEMLIMAIKRSNISFNDKRQMFDRIKEINIAQLEMLGQKVRAA